MSELITTDDVVFGLRAQDCASAAADLLRQTMSRRRFDGAEVERIATAVMNRERESATVCGPVLIPHARDARIASFLVAIGVNPDGVVADDADHRVMVAFVSPVDKRSEHLTLLSQLARLSRDTRAVDAIAGARDAASIISILRSRAD